MDSDYRVQLSEKLNSHSDYRNQLSVKLKSDSNPVLRNQLYQILKSTVYYQLSTFSLS